MVPRIVYIYMYVGISVYDPLDRIDEVTIRFANETISPINESVSKSSKSITIKRRWGRVGEGNPRRGNRRNTDYRV